MRVILSSLFLTLPLCAFGPLSLFPKFCSADKLPSFLATRPNRILESRLLWSYTSITFRRTESAGFGIAGR